MTTTERYVAQCGDCGWEGRRAWPSPVKPCPRCASTKISRELTGPYGWHWSGPWVDER